FLPIEIAVAATALVHGANNVLKAALLGKWADSALVLRFGAPAIVAALGGVYVLKLLSGMPELWSYSFLGRHAVMTPVKLAMAALMAVFALLELHPRFEKLEFDRRYLPAGGVLSGFFGGLSGHQGALRSAFLAKVGISAQAFVGTNAVIGLLVDLVRISAYGAILFGSRIPDLAGSREGALVAAGALAAFAGVLVGRRILHKVTMAVVQRITGGLLLLIAALLGLGLV
ncbi:MAG: TSUP family transporter, partial [Candidatus Eisenbacteria bacterium]|nr:TSUP family transporter [Candidatus Eisenbacteria bacterium]